MKWLRLKLPEKLRRKLKKPLGELISGSNNHIYLKILSLIDKYKPVKLVSVGDRVKLKSVTNETNIDNLTEMVEEVRDDIKDIKRFIIGK